MARVGIVMGSDSDLEIMAKAAEMLDKFGIAYDVTVISAHRMRDGSGDHTDSGDWCADSYKILRGSRFPVFYRADAVRYSGSYGSH